MAKKYDLDPPNESAKQLCFLNCNGPIFTNLINCCSNKFTNSFISVSCNGCNLFDFFFG